MEQYLNETCKILIDFKGKNLFYIGKVTAIDDTHIHFIDKHGVPYSYNKKYIDQVCCISGKTLVKHMR